MAFTAPTHTAFFQNAPQMALNAAQRTRLAHEGLVVVEDFSDFQSDQLDQAFKNMRASIPGVPEVLDAHNNVVVPAIPPVLPCIISAKCSLRLKVAAKAYHYYYSIGRARTPANMNYSTVLKNFHTEHEALLKLAKKDPPKVPTLSKSQTPIRWMESFKDCLFRTFGVRDCPLLYVIRQNAAVPAEATDPLLPGSYYGVSGSLVDEMVARLDHTDALFRSDNAAVFSLLEEASRGTVYAPTIKPYSRRKDGRAAWEAMVSSHAGKDKWEQLQKEKLSILMTTKWNGRQYSLEKFTGIHRSAYVQLEEAAIHVNFQLPTAYSRVGFLLDNIISSDPDLRAALASVRIDQNGMRSDFEKAVAFILPVCPYAKHRQHNPQTKTPQISDTTLKGKEHSKTGVDLRWHTKSEYAKLSGEQKKELYQWQSTKDGRAKILKDKKELGIPTRSSKTNAKLKAKISALEAQLQENPTPSLEEITACIAAASSSLPAPPAPAKKVQVTAPTEPHKAAAMAVQSILKRKRED